ncbi:MAG: hypothetical protein LIV24_08580 [Eubacterium sp.]|nr:hypothetical protein [Eubacterium sp.]
MRKVLAICDTEREYAVRFMDYLNTRQNLPFEIHSFTALESLKEFVREHPVEILLIAEGAFREEVRQMPIRTVVLLTEDGSALTEGGCQKDLSFRQIYKYQGQSHVVREVMDCYGAEIEATGPAAFAKPSCRMTGVCSLSDAGQKVIFSMVYGRFLAEQTPCLYLNLEPKSGMERLLPDAEKNTRTLSDVMYFYRRGRNGLIYQLNTMLHKFGALDYLMPVKNAADIREMTEKQWIGMLSELMQTSTYGRILVDLDWQMRGFSDLIDACDEVFVISHGDPVSVMRNHEFAVELRAEAGAEKIREVILPDPDGHPGNDHFLERQTFGRVGRTIRSGMQSGWKEESGA